MKWTRMKNTSATDMVVNNTMKIGKPIKQQDELHDEANVSAGSAPFARRARPGHRPGLHYSDETPGR